MDKLRSEIERHLTELCLRIGSRHCGSEGEKRAADYIEKFWKEECHLPVVRECFPQQGWRFRSFQFMNLTTGEAVPVSTPCYFSPGVTVEAPLFWIGSGKIPQLESLDVKGKFCFVEFWHGSGSPFGVNALAEKLDAKGAAAAVFISNGHTALAPSTKCQRSPFLNCMGACAVAQTGAMYLTHHKNDLFRLVIDAERYDDTGCNVIARIPGPSPDSPKIVVGGHYDTAPLIQGAGDNASGTVMTMEMARILSKEKLPVAVDFVAFDAEEYIPKDFPPGSGDYIKRHKNENIRMLLNFDDFGARISRPYLMVGLKEKLPEFASRWPEEPAPGNGDDRSFNAAGIPSVWYFSQDPFQHLHTAADTIENMDYDLMKDGVEDALRLFHQIAEQLS